MYLHVSPLEKEEEEVEEVFRLEVHIDLSLKLEKGETYQVRSK